LIFYQLWTEIKTAFSARK